MSESPIPAYTADLPDWLDVLFPEFSPRTPADVPEALARGAQRELIESIRAAVERCAEESLDVPEA